MTLVSPRTFYINYLFDWLTHTDFTEKSALLCGSYYRSAGAASELQ
jgi:NAD(P)H-dependent FMN reductase